jgi:hypothetical protein
VIARIHQAVLVQIHPPATAVVPRRSRPDLRLQAALAGYQLLEATLHRQRIGNHDRTKYRPSEVTKITGPVPRRVVRSPACAVNGSNRALPISRATPSVVTGFMTESSGCLQEASLSGAPVTQG